jgi:hypothetical protein
MLVMADLADAVEARELGRVTLVVLSCRPSRFEQAIRATDRLEVRQSRLVFEIIAIAAGRAEPLQRRARHRDRLHDLQHTHATLLRGP